MPKEFLKKLAEESIKKNAGTAVTTKESNRIKKEMAKDPYMSRNEFKPGFYDQKDKPATTVETIKGTGATAPNITDTESFVGGGEVELTKGKDYIKDLL
jgi:phage-related tail protein